MTDQEYACYEVKLNRLFNIQSKQNVIWLVVLSLLFILYLVINVFNNSIEANGIIISACGYVAVMLVKLLSYPRCLDITPDTVRFQFRGALLSLLTTGHVRSGSGNDSKYEKTYTLYNLQSIEYLQTPFEKIFSVGHIRICGDLNKSNGRGKEQSVFVIYGVKDFKNTSAWMKDYVKLSKGESK